VHALYFDEDSMSVELVRSLRRLGVSVLTAAEANMLKTSDAAELAFATSVDRVLCTKNAGDFQALHELWLARGEHHAGIVAVTRPYFQVGVQFRGLRGLLDHDPPIDMRDNMVWLSRFVRPGD
jgi:hypothetical protein